MPEYKTTAVPTPSYRTTHLRPATAERKQSDWDKGRQVINRLDAQSVVKLAERFAPKD